MSEISETRDTLELISQVRKEDGAAFEALLEKYTPLIDASVLKVLGEEQLTVYRDHTSEATATATLQASYETVLAYEENGEFILCGEAKAIVVKPE